MADRPVDIRDTSAEEYWGDFEHKWTALLTYRYLGRLTPELDIGVDAITMPLRHDMRNATGGILAAPLCIASPETGGIIDDVAVPNPVIASMQVLDDARDVRALAVHPETIKIGRTMGFSRARIVDLDNPSRVVALSEGVGVSIGDTPGHYEKVENPPVDVVDSPDLPPLHQVFGATRREPGVWQLGELVEEMASPDAALHLGPQHVVLEAAASDLAALLAGTDALQIQSWHVMFVARGKTGPFRAEGRAFAGTGERVGCSVSLYDEGNGDRVVTSASALFRPAT
jgi:hypothetical protein